MKGSAVKSETDRYIKEVEIIFGSLYSELTDLEIRAIQEREIQAVQGFGFVQGGPKGLVLCKESQWNGLCVFGSEHIDSERISIL